MAERRGKRQEAMSDGKEDMSNGDNITDLIKWLNDERKQEREEEKERNEREMLPYVLFAYREVPQESTGYSPFQLLYGRRVRGPLDVLKENWEENPKSPSKVTEYVVKIKENLKNWMDEVQRNLTYAQKKQKEWYDMHSQTKTFEKDDEVLVLLPCNNNKLPSEWQGPYIIEEKKGPVNYRVRIPIIKCKKSKTT